MCFRLYLCTFDTLLINLVQQVCFDFARIVATVMTVEILPTETIIRSITSILSQDVNELSSIRYALAVSFSSSLDSYTPSSDVMWSSQKSRDVADIPQFCFTM